MLCKRLNVSKLAASESSQMLRKGYQRELKWLWMGLFWAL
jgi:hypothetical protein